jgi:predicted TPR repeat methyltransferase
MLGGMAGQDALGAEQLFDTIAEDYERAFGRPPIVGAAVAELIARLPQRGRVLDIGSGTGVPAASDLVGAGFDVLGLDVSSRMVEIARERVPGAQFQRIDVRDFDAEQGSLQAVCAFFPFLQLPRADTEAVLGRAAGWLSPGGLLAMVTVPADVEDAPISFLGHPARVTSFAADDLERLLQGVGLEVLHRRSEQFSPDHSAAEPEEHLLLLARRPG